MTDTTCFQNILGLSHRDCECFTQGRPEDQTSQSISVLSWKSQSFDAGGSPATPFVITTAENLPEPLDVSNIQLFQNGVLLAPNVAYTKTGAKTLSVPVVDPLDRFQLWYKTYYNEVKDTPAYNYSDSGFFITQLLPEEEIKSILSCDQTVWDLMDEARDIAIRQFIADMSATLTMRHRNKYPTFSGFIGEPNGLSRLSSAKQYAYVRIRTNGMPSGYLKIKGIAAMFEKSGNLALTIYDQHGQIITPTFNISTLAGSRSITPVQITLPLLRNYETEQDYFIVYQYDATNKPLLNALKCTCGDMRTFIPTRNTTNWIGYDNLTGKRAWHNFIIMGGGETDSVANFYNEPAQVTEYNNGLSFQVELGCDVASGYCKLVETMGANQWGMSIAQALQYKAAAYLLKKRVSTSLPNRQNLINKDQNAQSAKEYEAEYATIIQYLAKNLPDGSNDCMECGKRMRMGGILS